MKNDTWWVAAYKGEYLTSLYPSERSARGDFPSHPRITFHKIKFTPVIKTKKKAATPKKKIIPEIGDRVNFKTYTRPDKELTGEVVNINRNYPWRGGYTTVVNITGDDGYEYIINAERVTKA